MSVGRIRARPSGTALAQPSCVACMRLRVLPGRPCAAAHEHVAHATNSALGPVRAAFALVRCP
jgi:hypothetical protein